MTIMLAADKNFSFPPTRTEPVVEKLHGVEVSDPYRWLENADDANVKAWTDQQNAYTRSVLERLPGRERIHKRLGELLEIGRLGTPQPAKGRYFYTKRTGKQNQAILYVREGLRNEDRILIDPNQLSKDGTIALDWWHVNHDGRLLAYGLSKDGSEMSVLHVLDVATGKDLPDVIEQTRACSLAWTPGGNAFYYTRYPKPGSVPKGEENYYRHVFYHELGGDPAKDPKIFGDGRNPQDWPNVELSPDGKHLVVTVEQGWAKSEVYYKDLAANRPFIPIVEGVEAIYDAIVRNGRLFLRTNENAPRYKVMRVDLAKPARGDWTEVVPESEDVLDHFTTVGDKFVGLYMRNASSRLRVWNADSQARAEVPLPTLGSIEGLGSEWDGNELLFGFSSYTVPPSVFHVDMKTPAPALWQQLPADMRADDYEVKQVHYASKDGTQVSMFVAHRKGMKPDGDRPTYLYGYGGFNISLKPAFSPSLLLFLEKGGVVAIAHLRGGSEYGEAWHKAGMLDKKQNVFDDYIAAAEWLIANRYTTPKRLAIEGRSNGGLLIGAAITQRPDLFRAAICGVPLLDMLRYHKFRIAKLWIPEYGDPEDPKDFQWLRAYSPYHNVKDATAYPATFIMTAESDTRVDAMHARKMAARLQAATSGTAPILLRLETKAGHGQGKPRTKVVEELTDVWTFLFWQLGMGM